MKKYVLLLLYFSCFIIKSSRPTVDMEAIEKIMLGNFFPVYTYEQLQTASTEKNITLFECELGTYYQMVMHALKKIDARRKSLKQKVESMIIFDDQLFNCNQFWNIIFYILRPLHTLFFNKNQCNTIDAYNNLTSMKKRLEKSIGMEKNKNNELALVFQKQGIFLNEDCPNEDIPKEVIQEKIIPYLLSNTSKISPKDIVLAAYWSDGVWGWAESFPPKGGIAIGLHSEDLHGQISSVLYGLCPREMSLKDKIVMKIF